MAEDYQMWIRHFIDQSKGLIPHQRVFYKLGVNSQKGEGKPTIQVVSPTQQVVERAKSTLQEQRKPSYDPVTGVVHQSLQNLLGKRIVRTGKNKSKKVKSRNSGRVTKKVHRKTKQKPSKKKKTNFKKSSKNKRTSKPVSWAL